MILVAEMEGEVLLPACAGEAEAEGVVSLLLHALAVAADVLSPVVPRTEVVVRQHLCVPATAGNGRSSR